MLLRWDKIKQKQDDVDSAIIDALSFKKCRNFYMLEFMKKGEKVLTHSKILH